MHYRPEGADEQALGSDAAGNGKPGQHNTDDDSGGGGELSQLEALMRGYRIVTKTLLWSIMYVCMWVCVYVGMCVCIYVSMYLCMHLCMYVSMYLCMYIVYSIDIYIYTYV